MSTLNSQLTGPHISLQRLMQGRGLAIHKRLNPGTVMIYNIVQT